MLYLLLYIICYLCLDHLLYAVSIIDEGYDGETVGIPLGVESLSELQFLRLALADGEVVTPDAVDGLAEDVPSGMSCRAVMPSSSTQT